MSEQHKVLTKSISGQLSKEKQVTFCMCVSLYKVKVAPVPMHHTMKTYGSVVVMLQASLTLALDRDKWALESVWTC